MPISNIDKLLNMSDFIARSDLEQSFIVTRSWVVNGNNRIEALLKMLEGTILDSIIMSCTLIELMQVFEAKFINTIFY